MNPPSDRFLGFLAKALIFTGCVLIGLGVAVLFLGGR